jgi:regulator of RNase E activity RraA
VHEPHQSRLEPCQILLTGQISIKPTNQTASSTPVHRELALVQVHSHTHKDSKTDLIDSHLIVGYLLSIEPEAERPLGSELEQFRMANRMRRRLMEQRSDQKNELNALLRRFFPGYQRIIGRALSRRLLYVLSSCRSPAVVLAATVEKMAEVRRGNRHRIGLAFAQKLREQSFMAPNRLWILAGVSRLRGCTCRRLVGLCTGSHQSHQSPSRCPSELANATMSTASVRDQQYGVFCRTAERLAQLPCAPSDGGQSKNQASANREQAGAGKGESMFFSDKETIVRLTPQWKGERLEDGRPKVPSKYLQALKKMTLEEAWKPIYLLGYEQQFTGQLRMLHPGKKLIGRAITCTFMPSRPDLHETLFDIGHNEEGRKGNYNQWVIDSLVEGDVLVADMYDKIHKGTIVGGNLTTAIASRTKNGGAVIWGGVRDVEQMLEVKDIQVFYRGSDVTPIRDCLMTGMNTPCHIGTAVCLPGDVVFGTVGGVLFIPAHLVEHVVDGAAKSHIRDVFGFELISTNRATTAEIDREWTLTMLEALEEFIRTDPRGEEYRNLDWTQEKEAAKKADRSDATKTML